METLDELEKTLFMQYALETLIEDYNSSKTDSDRYYAKLKLIDFIKQTDTSISSLVNYMSLSEEKFYPFISMLKEIRQNFTNSSANTSIKKSKPMIIKLITFGEY